VSGDEKQRPRKRWPWIVAILVIAVITLIVSSGKHDRDGVSTRLAAAVAGQETIAVSTGDVHEFVSAAGHLMPIATKTLSFDMPGRITRLKVEEGSRVTAGSVVCELEANSSASLPGDYLRSLQEWAPTPDTDAAEKKLASIRAPFDGVAVSVNASVGSYVTAGQPVITVIDTSSHVVDIEIDEIDLTRVSPGMEATITFDAIPGLKLPGKVDSIAQMAVPKGGIVTIPVRISVDGWHELLKPGLTASVKILSRTLSDVVKIPIRSWIDHEGEPSAIRIEDDIPIFVPLELGLSDGEYTHVLSGLEPGDIIVLDAVAVQEKLRRAAGQDRFITFDVQRIDD